MSIINADTKKYLENFSDKRFKEYHFVALLLPLLFQNGVYKIDERELERKLFYYYKNPNFRELFQDIVIEDLPSYKSVCLYDGFYQEKYFENGIWFDQMNSDILNLAYNKDIDLSLYEQYLSEDGRLKIRQIAQELSKRYKAEQRSTIKLSIYGINPNCHYQLVHGVHHNSLLSFELITDGDIQTINYQDNKGFEHCFYDSPFDPDEAVQLEDNKVVYIGLQNATYAIKQGLCDGKIRYCNVNTQLLDKTQLERVVDIANQKYNEAEYVLTEKAPYVRKLILK